MARFRTINEAYYFLKEQDPGTSLTPYFIRMMVVNDDVPTIKAGKKRLVDLDSLLEHLEKKLCEEKALKGPKTGDIRPVTVGRKLSR